MKTLFERAARIHIASRGSPRTRKLYAADLDRWLTFCRATKVSADEPTLEVAVAFRDHVQTFASLVTGKPLGDNTVRRILSSISSMYDAAGIVNHFKSAKHLPRPLKDESALTREFSHDEVVRLFEAALTGGHALCDIAIMRLLWQTGLRVGTVLKMRREKLHNVDGRLIFETKVKKRGTVKVMLPAESCKDLRRWLGMHNSEWVFPSTRGKGPLTHSTFYARLVEYGKAAGVDDVHPHRFRATFITEALDVMPLHEVQAAVHHSSSDTTLRYDRRKRGAGVMDAVAKMREQRR